MNRSGLGTDSPAVEEEEEDQGGVVLRREQVKLVLLGAKEAITEIETRGEPWL